MCSDACLIACPCLCACLLCFLSASLRIGCLLSTLFEFPSVFVLSLVLCFVNSARLLFFRWLCEVDETHESQKASAVEFKVAEKCDIGLLFFSRALMRFAFFSSAACDSLLIPFVEA